jgi:hypothetical protein
LATGKGKEYITMSERISNGQSFLCSMHRRTFIKGECAWARLVRNQSECLSWTTTNSFE